MLINLGTYKVNEIKNRKTEGAGACTVRLQII